MCCMLHVFAFQLCLGTSLSLSLSVSLSLSLSLSHSPPSLSPPLSLFLCVLYIRSTAAYESASSLTKHPPHHRHQLQPHVSTLTKDLARRVKHLLAEAYCFDDPYSATHVAGTAGVAGVAGSLQALPSVEQILASLQARHDDLKRCSRAQLLKHLKKVVLPEIHPGYHDSHEPHPSPETPKSPSGLVQH
jgi:hypothetical protein